jgi:hypothetical protein
MPQKEKNMPNIVLEVRRRSDDYHVCLKGNPKVCDCGKTVSAAIGKWVLAHGKELGVRVEATTKD